jgi:hypothetical protein
LSLLDDSVVLQIIIHRKDSAQIMRRIRWADVRFFDFTASIYIFMKPIFTGPNINLGQPSLFDVDLRRQVQPKVRGQGKVTGRSLIEDAEDILEEEVVAARPSG